VPLCGICQAFVSPWKLELWYGGMGVDRPDLPAFGRSPLGIPRGILRPNQLMPRSWRGFAGRLAAAYWQQRTTRVRRPRALTTPQSIYLRHATGSALQQRPAHERPHRLEPRNPGPAQLLCEPLVLSWTALVQLGVLPEGGASRIHQNPGTPPSQSRGAVGGAAMHAGAVLHALQPMCDYNQPTLTRASSRLASAAQRRP
jgi:hypothetical protein